MDLYIKRHKEKHINTVTYVIECQELNPINFKLGFETLTEKFNIVFMDT